jgi:hypothetical protein
MRSCFSLAIATSLVAACTEGGARRTMSNSTGDDDGGDETCAKVEKDIAIRSEADFAAAKLPQTGCYDLYGKLTLTGTGVTSLAGLKELNSVNELELDHTGLTTIDSPRPIGIYGRLAVTGNAKLTGLAQLSFEEAATGIVIDSNAALASLEPLALGSPKLEEVTGDLAITNNAALTAARTPYLTRVAGAVSISGNAALTTIDLGRLAQSGRVAIANNAKLTSIAGFASGASATIGGDLAISGNAALATLGTMSALYRVTGSVTIDNNAALTNLAAFTTSLRFIDQTLTVTNNPKLLDLGALKYVSLVNAIRITNNTALVACRAIEIDQCVAHSTSSVINNNKQVACNWQCN